jgi:glucose/arabinose dehydrogenase
MVRLLLAAFVAALVVVAGCGNSDSPSSPPGSGSGQTITGQERIGWTQTANSSGDFGLYEYALYVDGGRRVLSNTSCTPTAVDTTMECSAPLPSMTPGRHTLELAVFITSGDTIVESTRSAPLAVTLAAVTASVDEIPTRGETLVSSDGLTVRVDVVARGLTDPVDLAAAPDGRLLIAERSGRVRIAGTGAGDDDNGNAEDLFARALREPDAALTSMALAPDFVDNRLVYVTYVSRERSGAILRLARLREIGGRFGEAAVLASHPIPDEATALLRWGPDNRLYIGIGTGHEPDRAQQLASAAGKILRLAPDGSAPDDNPWQSPVFSAGHREPRGLAWHAGNGVMWEIDADANADELNVVHRGANYGWPVANGATRHPRVMSPALLLPPGTEAAGLTTIADPASPLTGDLIVAALAGEDLLRVRADAAGGMHVAGRLLQGRYGRIRQVASGTDGSLYAITDNGDRWAPGNDIAIRVAVRRQAAEK